LRVAGHKPYQDPLSRLVPPPAQYRRGAPHRAALLAEALAALTKAHALSAAAAQEAQASSAAALQRDAVASAYGAMASESDPRFPPPPPPPPATGFAHAWDSMKPGPVTDSASVAAAATAARYGPGAAPSMFATRVTAATCLLAKALVFEEQGQWDEAEQALDQAARQGVVHSSPTPLGLDGASGSGSNFKSASGAAVRFSGSAKAAADALEAVKAAGGLRGVASLEQPDPSNLLGSENVVAEAVDEEAVVALSHVQHEALCRLGMLRLSRAEALEQDMDAAVRQETSRLARNPRAAQEAEQQRDLAPVARRQRQRALADALASHSQTLDESRRRRTELLAGAEQALREAAANGSEKALGYLGTAVRRTGRLGLAVLLLRQACAEQTSAAVGGGGGRTLMPGEIFFECGLAATHAMLGDCLGAVLQQHAGAALPDDAFDGQPLQAPLAVQSAHEVPTPGRAEAAAEAVAAYRFSVKLKPTSAELQLKLGAALLAKASSLEPYYAGEVRAACQAQGLLEPLQDDQASVVEAELSRGGDLDDACQAFDLVLHFTRPPTSGESGDGRGMDAGDLSPEADPSVVARAGQMHYEALYGAGLAHLQRRRFLRAAALFRRCRALQPWDGAAALSLGSALLQEVQCRVAAFDGDVQAKAAALAAAPGAKADLWRKPPPSAPQGASAAATQEYWRRRFLRAQRGAAQQDAGKQPRAGTVFAAMLEPPAPEHAFVSGQ
jgi:hypothetical protein